MTDRSVFFVWGPESSGTRLTTEILIAAGCYGDSGHAQRLDRDIDSAVPDVPWVWRRSFPHGGMFYDPQALIFSYRLCNRVVKLIVMTRDQGAMVRSQMAAGHVQKEQQARDNIRRAYAMIYGAAAEFALPLYTVTYEALVHDRGALDRLMAWCGLKLPDHLPFLIYDGNRKYRRYQE